MIWLAVLALAQTAPALADPALANPALADDAAGEEITVMGRRVAALSVMLNRDGAGKLSCDLSESSGDHGIDVELCKTAARCFKQGAVAAEAMRGCIDARKPAILNDFAARLRARQG